VGCYELSNELLGSAKDVKFLEETLMEVLRQVVSKVTVLSELALSISPRRTHVELVSKVRNFKCQIIQIYRSTKADVPKQKSTIIIIIINEKGYPVPPGWGLGHGADNPIPIK
jgi:hypothetical protein